MSSCGQLQFLVPPPVLIAPIFVEMGLRLLLVILGVRQTPKFRTKKSPQLHKTPIQIDPTTKFQEPRLCCRSRPVPSRPRPPLADPLRAEALQSEASELRGQLKRAQAPPRPRLRAPARACARAPEGREVSTRRQRSREGAGNFFARPRGRKKPAFWVGSPAEARST